MAKKRQKSNCKVLVVTSTIAPIRKLRDGIVRFARETKSFSVVLREDRSDEDTLTDDDYKSFDGFIGYADAKIQRELARHDIPIVQIDEVVRKDPFCAGSIRSDNAGIGKAAADWLCERRYTTFAAVGNLRRLPWSVERIDAFRARLGDRGFDCTTYPTDRTRPRLADWLAALPKPVAVFVVHDILARQVADECRTADLDVPHEVSILSVDNDEAICEYAAPTISSIQTTTEQAGYEAAKALHGLISGPKPRRRQRPVEIRYTADFVVERQTTRWQTSSEPVVAAAQRYMEQHFAQHLTVDVLAAELKVSRRYLEIRFRTALGRSPHEELLNLRLEKAKSLIETTVRSYTDIASACGFSSPFHLGNSFKKRFGRTPSSFRSKS